MTFAHSDFSRRAGRGRRPGDERTRVGSVGTQAARLLGLAAMVALLAWLAIAAGNAPDPADSAADRGEAAGSLQQGDKPLFDGRGKWSGYAD